MESLTPHQYRDPIVPPMPASTVIPLRENNGGIEVYMTQRSPRLKFLGGFYVFPGGALDKQDYASEAISRCVGVEPAQAKKILNSELSPEVCLGHWIAGIRELFEEAGILLVYDKRGNIPDFNIRRVRKKIDGYRALIQQGKISMNEMMKKNDFRYAVDQLVYFSHWVTPPGPPKRFDTRFFITVTPETQRPRFHTGEVKEGIWLTPGEALKKTMNREWRMIPPTIISLQTIAQYKTIEELISSYR